MGHDWPNRILMMVYDRRTAELFGGRFPLPQPGTSSAWVISGETWPALAAAISERLQTIAPRTGGFTLAPEFAKNLEAQVRRFDGFARKGVDPDFARGKHLYDRRWHSMIWSYPEPGHEVVAGGSQEPDHVPVPEEGARTTRSCWRRARSTPTGGRW